MQPISRDNADASKFYMGVPCKRGHDGKRYQGDGSCVECKKAYRATPNGRIAYLAYKGSPAQLEAKERHRISPIGRASKRKWERTRRHSPEGKAQDAKRRASPKYQAWQAAHNMDPQVVARRFARHHERTYGEPIAARFFRYVGQRYRDDISGDFAAFADLHQDHDHASGRCRGLISKTNNGAVGMLGDSPMRAVQVAQYLIRHAMDDPDHPLLADHNALRAIKIEAEQLAESVGKLIDDAN